MTSIQNDLNTISEWISSHFLSINTNKSKCMIITRKSSQFVFSLPPVTLNSTPIELVSSFKYLGVIISSNLFWSLHIQSVSSKVRKLTGMIYRNFYKSSSPQILLKLYNALVLPHFNYCSSVWSPPNSSVNSSLLDSTNYFSLKVCSKIWSLNYHSLISYLNNIIPSLVFRWNCSKLILLFKIKNDILFFPFNVLLPVPTPLRYSQHYNKDPPFVILKLTLPLSFLHLFSYGTLSLKTLKLPPPSLPLNKLFYHCLKISYLLLLSLVYCIKKRKKCAKQVSVHFLRPDKMRVPDLCTILQEWSYFTLTLTLSATSKYHYPMAFLYIAPSIQLVSLSIFLIKFDIRNFS